MFKFYVDLAGHDKITDTDWATTFMRKFQGPSSPTRSTKNAVFHKNMGFNRKKVWRIQMKKKRLNAILA